MKTTANTDNLDPRITAALAVGLRDVSLAKYLLEEADAENERLRELLREAWALPEYPAGTDAEWSDLDARIRSALDGAP